MKIKILVGMVSAALTVVTTTAGAQTTSVAPQYKIGGSEEKDGPQGFPLGEGVALYPYFNVSVGNDDNLFLNNTNKKSSGFQIYNPGANLVIRSSQAAQWAVGYDLKAGKYSSSSADDYTDYKFFGSGEFAPARDIGLRLGADYTRGHDPRGSTDRTISASPDEYRSSGGSGLLAYGSNDAIGRLEFDLSTNAKRYINNRTNTQFGDKDTNGFGGRFFYRIAPKTSLLFEASQTKYDYVLNPGTQNSKEQRYLIGVTWDATALTSGTIKVGTLKKDFESAARPDFTGSAWEAQVRWAPLSYSKFDFTTSKSIADSTGVGLYTLSKRYGVAWTHAWDSKLSSTASFNRTNDEFVSSTPKRDDSTNASSVGFTYKIQRWMMLGGSYTNTKRDSGIDRYDYTRNMYMLTLGLTL